MIYLDDKTDSILPYGLKSTPFEVVYKALQAVASTVWPVDAAALRAAVGWGWYLVNAPDKLAEASAGRVFVQNALISECVPLVKATQTQAELVDLLARWRAYRPTFGALEGLYLPYAATADVRPITDAATQAILPVTDIHGAFYVVITDVDWARPLTLDEAVLIAERATPMGSRPIALYGFEVLTPVTATAANGDAWIFVDSVEIAQEPPAPPVVAVPLCGSMGADYSESMTAPIAERMERGGIGFTGSLRENIIPESGVVEAPVDELTAYFTTQGSSSTSDFYFSYGTHQLYHSDGSVIYPTPGVTTYTLVNVYDYAGNVVTPPFSFEGPFNNSGTICAFTVHDFYAYKLTYTES